jgi:hypothetical protein
MSVGCERSRHQPGVAALDCWVAKRPGKEPQGRLVQLRQASGVDHVLHARERLAPWIMPSTCSVARSKDSGAVLIMTAPPFWSRGHSACSTADSPDSEQPD